MNEWLRSPKRATMEEKEKIIDGSLLRYALVIMDKKYVQREVVVAARNAEDALTIADFNHCRSYDFDGKKTEAVYSIRAL